jgi:putative oxidoreductase
MPTIPIPVAARNPSAWRIANLLHLLRGVRGLLLLLQPVALLFMRLYVAHIFFLSDLTKVRDRGTTVALFIDEYHVLILSPQLAAAMGAGGELVLPVLLMLLAFGLGGRFATLGLFVMNIVAVISYADITPADVQQHNLWGARLLMLLLCGPGKLSLDGTWLKRFWGGLIVSQSRQTI